MIARVSQGWQVTLADLSLILFITTAAALTQARKDAADIPAGTVIRSGEAVAIYRGGAQMPEMNGWLLSQPQDPRQQLTIVARYLPGGRVAAAAEAARLAGLAEEAGKNPRVILEPGPAGEVLAFLAFDAGAAGAADVAQGLQDGPVIAAR